MSESGFSAMMTIEIRQDGQTMKTETSKPKERDFRFGEKVTKLRLSRGLTQEFVAMRLHVSDGAVSKWETGAAKPASGRAAALARLLGVDVDMLLDDDALTPDEAFELKDKQKQVIWKKAADRAITVYGNNPPFEITDRYFRERDLLENSDAIILFDLLGEVRKTAKQMRFHFHAPDPQSFIGWLLGASDINPLGAHLRCPECHRTEFRPEVRSGLDLPEKKCECGTRMIPDGHSIPFEVTPCAEGSSYDFYQCETDIPFMETAEDIILRYGERFYDMEITRNRETVEPETDNEGHIVRDPETGKKIMHRYLPMSFLMFGPKKKATVRKPEKISGPMEVDNWGKRPGQPAIVLMPGTDGPSYLPPEDNVPGTPDELIRPETVERALKDYWNAFPELQELHGTDIKIPDLKPYLGNLTFSRFIDLICSVNCLYMCSGPEELAGILGIEDLTEIPYTPEDLWRMISECTPYPGYMEGSVRQLIRRAVTGRYVNKNIPKRNVALFGELKLPGWFGEYMQNIFSLNPRSCCISLGIRMLEDARRKIRDEKRNRRT